MEAETNPETETIQYQYDRNGHLAWDRRQEPEARARPDLL